MLRIISPRKGRRPGDAGRLGASAVPAGDGVIGFAPGRSGHHACRHYDRRARCVAGSGQGNLSTKPGPGRTKGQHTPWQEPWWNAGRRACPIAEGRRKPPCSVARPAPVWCGTDDSATAGVPLSFISLRSPDEQSEIRDGLEGLLIVPAYRSAHAGYDEGPFDIAV